MRAVATQASGAAERAPAPPPSAEEAATDWPARVRDALGSLPVSLPVPGFDPTTLLPTPDMFDDPIASVEQAARTFAVMGGNLEGVLGEVLWNCNDATEFRQRFSEQRRAQLQERAGDLNDLAADLRRIQGRTMDEREWIQAIDRNVRGFLDAVRVAYEAALATAVEVHRETTSALGNLAGSGLSVVQAGWDTATGGDGRDELDQAVRRAEAAVGDARAALDAVVDFTTSWPFNAASLPVGVCRAWYDVDEVMASKSGTPEAYGVTYPAMGRYGA